MLAALALPLATATLLGAAAPPVMTLPEALGYARAHQPRIRAALAEVAARRAEVRVPRAAWLPQVGATAQLFVGTANNTTASYLGVGEMDIPRIGGSKSATQATAAWAPSASSLAGIGVTQEVYDFGRISAQIAVADAQAALARADADAVTLDVVLAVEEAFHAVLAGKAVLAATEDAYKRALTHRDFAQAGDQERHAAAHRPTRAQADVARSEVRRVRAQAGLEARARRWPRRWAPTRFEVDAAEAPDVWRRRRRSTRRCVRPRRNPAIVAALAHPRRRARGGARGDARAAAERRSRSAALTRRAGGATPSSGEAPYGAGWLPDVANWHLGLVLSWNLFDGDGAGAARGAAGARRGGARRSRPRAQQSSALAAERAYLDSQRCPAARFPDCKPPVDAARANQAQADARFSAGLGTIVELADAEALLTDEPN